MTRKIIAILTALLLVASFCACNNGNKDEESTKDDNKIEIRPEDVYCFFIEGKKLFASLKRGDALIKKRLYEIEEMLGGDFIKINQSTVANMKLIDRFSVSIGATLTVHFKNGRRDYVSRRQMKAVKERLGI